MGSDIHMVAQKRTADGWERVEPFKYCEYEKKQVRGMQNTYRSYFMFALLAGVRNGFGFAGCKIFDPVVPIAEGRGLPDDFQIDDNECHEGSWMGDHSYTWMTLDEILAADTTRKVKKSGWINGIERKQWVESQDAQPPGWCGGISGQGVEHVSLDELDFRLKEGMPCDRHYAFAEWEVPMSVALGDDFMALVEHWKTLDPDPRNVRLVMGFDS